MFYIDPVYFWYVFIPVLIISVGVQIYLKRTHAKWSKVANSDNAPGVLVAKEIFNSTSLQAIQVERVSGNLTDHFDRGRQRCTSFRFYGEADIGGGDGGYRP